MRMEDGGGGEGGRGGEERNAGRCLFKTRTQHYRMVGEKTPQNHAQKTIRGEGPNIFQTSSGERGE
eukprot:367700-Pyramimonas_sp.AAC.1